MLVRYKGDVYKCTHIVAYYLTHQTPLTEDRHNTDTKRSADGKRLREGLCIHERRFH